jgi:signal transduction histidine kinase
VKPLTGILRSKRFYLFGLIVLLPAALLAVFAVRTFQSELIRYRFQVQERQQQINRLFENDLNDWLETAISSKPDDDMIRFQVRNGTLLFPALNVWISGRSRDSVPFSDLEASALRRAQTLERESKGAEAAAAYRQLLGENAQTAALARLSLLRLAIAGNQKEDTVSWLSQIQDHDRRAFSQTGVPVWVGSALLLISGSNLDPVASEFLQDVLSELQKGTWNLEGSQWAYYGRTISVALQEANPTLSAERAISAPTDEIVETANWLESAIVELRGIITLQLPLEGEGPSHVRKTYLPDLQAIAVFREFEGQYEGLLIDEVSFLEEAAEILNSLTVAEDFEGSLVVGSGAIASATVLSSFPGMGIIYSGEAASRRFFDFQIPLFSYLMTVLLLVIVVALFFIYRAVSHQIELTRMKTDFVSAVSHEFRSPLSAIQALLERVESGKASEPEMLARYHQVIRQEVHRLTQMVNELLDFARLEDGKREFAKEMVNLSEVAREVLTSFENLGYQKRLATDFHDDSDPPVVQADRTAVSQCVQNLVDNALKYSPDDLPITVRTGRNSADAFIEVNDRGPGVPDSEQSKIFEPFYRVGSTDVRRVKGVGFGLSLVKRMVEEQGGRVSLHSEVGRGCTFRLAFPVQRSGEF